MDNTPQITPQITPNQGKSELKQGQIYVMINPDKVKAGSGPSIVDADQQHPLDQPNDQYSLAEDGTAKKSSRADIAWATRVGEEPFLYTQIVICPGRVVRVNESATILAALDQRILVRCDQGGKRS